MNAHQGEPNDITYRSSLSSLFAAHLLFTLGFIVVLLLALPFTPNPFIAALVVPIPVAVWRAATVSVTLGLDEVVVRNLVSTRRLRFVTRAVPEPRGPRGMLCITFSSQGGRAVPACAMLVWSRGLLHPRATASTERLSAVLQTWASDCLEHRGVEVQLDPNYRDPVAFRRDRNAAVRNEMSLTDPVESMRSVRKALVGSMLVAVRPANGGFRVYVDPDNGSRVSESMDYPTMSSAIDAAVAEIGRLILVQPDEPGSG